MGRRSPWSPIFNPPRAAGQISPGSTPSLIFPEIADALGISDTASDVLTSPCPILDTLTDVSITDTTSVVVSGDYAYVGSFFSSTITAIDISDPSNMVVVDSLTDGTALLGVADLAVSGSHLFAVSEAGYIVSINISTPSSMVIADTLTGGSITSSDGIAISGTHAFITEFNGDGLVAVDISNPAAMAEVDFVTAASMNGAYKVAISGTHAYVASIGVTQSITSINISTPAAMSVVDSVADASLDQNEGLAVTGNYLLCADNDSFSVTSVDISNPAALAIADVLTDTSAFPSLGGITVIGSEAFVVSRDDVHRVDVSDPTAMTITGSLELDTFGFMYGPAVYGDQMIISASSTEAVYSVLFDCVPS